MKNSKFIVTVFLLTCLITFILARCSTSSGNPSDYTSPAPVPTDCPTQMGW
ncbi:MAG: hypothetical protein ACLFQV_06325 [Vulcanimicrobiota bacterium]